MHDVRRRLHAFSSISANCKLRLMAPIWQSCLTRSKQTDGHTWTVLHVWLIRRMYSWCPSGWMCHLRSRRISICVRRCRMIYGPLPSALWAKEDTSHWNDHIHITGHRRSSQRIDNNNRKIIARHIDDRQSWHRLILYLWLKLFIEKIMSKI